MLSRSQKHRPGRRVIESVKSTGLCATALRAVRWEEPYYREGILKMCCACAAFPLLTEQSHTLTVAQSKKSPANLTDNP